MESIIKNVLMHDLMILDREGVEYTILSIDHKNGYDAYEIRIDGDEYCETIDTNGELAEFTKAIFEQVSFDN